MANLSSVNLPYIGDGQFIRSATAKVTKNGVDYERQIVVLGDPDNPDSVLSLSNGALPIAATNLDIRSLSDTRDSVRVNNTVTVSGTVNIGNSVSVSATDLDIRNLSSAQDSVSVTGTVALDSASLSALETISVNNFPTTQAVSGTVTANLGTLNGAATAANQTTGNTSLSSIDSKLPDESGTWGYNAGVSGTLTVAANKRILAITATSSALAAASMTINGGQTITIPAGASITITPKANLTAPTIVFTSTASYFVEFVE